MDNNTTLAAKMAFEAYNSCPTMPGYDVQPFSSGNICGFTATRDRDLWLVFCGTNDALDWIDNANVTTEDTPFGSVHAGYKHALDSVWSNIAPLLDQRPWTRVYIAGHSMGGALAALTAARLSKNGWLNLMLWTFGQPRCGDRRWAKRMDEVMPTNYIRVVNAGDAVPHVPIAVRFKHAGQPLFFDIEGQPVKPTFWRVLWETARAFKRGHRPFAAHAMSLYCGNINL